MNSDASPVQQEIEFVWRRLAESLHLFGREIDGRIWWVILIPVLIAALVYVVWMYLRDSQTVGWRWATFLGLLRSIVYVVLALVFLLPALQTYDKTETKARVLVLFDVSGSMNTQDDIPTAAVPLEKLLTRQDKIIRFLSDSQIAFLKRLLDKNPVYLYRFGGQLDPEPKALEPDRPLPTGAEWNAWLKPDPRIELPKDKELTPEEVKVFNDKRELYGALVNATSLGDAILAALNREGNNRLQGIIVISDGRSTTFSEQTFADLQARALRLDVPIFTVGVGEQREPIDIRITDVQVPDQARPDDKFPIRVEAEGKNLADQDVTVNLDVYKPNTNPKKDKPAYQMDMKTKFSNASTLPHAQVEFEIDPAQVPAELRKPVAEGDAAKPELEEGQYQFVARIAKDKREVFAGKEHVSDPATVNIIKKPLRVLLFTHGPTREYQFLRTMFVREGEKGRAELSIRLQLGRPDIVQDVPAERLLKRFPGTLRDTEESGEDKYDNLAQYDVIIAFDPDWTELSAEQAELLEKWVGSHYGGLIVIGGPINTYQLTRSVNMDTLKPIVDLYPVYLEDNRLHQVGLDRSTSEPYRLHFPGASNEMEFLKLDESVANPLEAWEEFFTGQKNLESGPLAPLRRGFYSYYPIKDKKPNATVVATFTGARLNDGREEPYLVTMPYGNGKVVWLSSGEMWRLRQYHEAYNERFWTKLARYAGSGNLTRLNRHGTLVMSKTFVANNYVRLEAQLFGQDMQPLDDNAKPRLTIKPPAGVHMPTAIELAHKVGSKDGWFQGRFLVTEPGRYELELPVPGTTDILNAKIDVKPANPELDNVMPDFVHLRQIASDAARVMNRVDPKDRPTVKRELERTNKVQPTENTAENTDERLRLYFDLKGAAVIPDCMRSDPKVLKTRGPVKDLWDEGFIVDDSSNPPLKVSYVLLGIVALLSIEWLTRKLLKLA